MTESIVPNARITGKRTSSRPRSGSVAAGAVYFFRRALGLCLLATMPCEAVLFFATGDSDHNTEAPEDDLAGSGWQYQGRWLSYLGTPIAPQFFLTASHVGGQVGDVFTFEGVDYTTVDRWDDPASDLRIWRVCGEFPVHAELYTKDDETGKDLVVFGRGTRRGAAVEVSGGLIGGTELKGWKPGESDRVMRWGRNRVSSVMNGDGLVGPVTGGGDGAVGEILKIQFDRDGLADEAHLSSGDSGGGVFIRDGDVWKLAGINFAVSGPYNTESSGNGFNAAVFDEGGLYTGGSGNWSRNPDLPADLPGAFFATRIASNLDWIRGVIENPAPLEEPIVALQSAVSLDGIFSGVPGASVDLGAKTIRVERPAGDRFFRIEGCRAVTITGIVLDGGSIVITYE